MTFRAYLDTIKEKTGLGPADFRRLAGERGLLDAKAGEVVAWLKADYGLGQGHAMAIFSTFKDRPSASDRLDRQFTGGRAHWRPVVDRLLKGTAKFAVLATTADRLDVGIKLRDATAFGTSPRVEPSGSWNAMVTHRVRVTDPAQVDAELLVWLRAAYDAA